MEPGNHAPAQRPTQVRWLIFGLACAVSWLLYLHRYSWGVIKPALKREYGLDDVALGYLDSLFSLTYTLGQVPVGLTGDIVGPRAVLAIIILLWSTCVAALGLAGTVTGLGIIRGMFGVAQAGAYPNLGKVTRSWFPLSIRTTVQGAVGSLSGRAGGACAALIVGSVLMGGLGLGWRASLGIIGCAGVVLGVLFWFLFRNNPAEHPWTNAAERRLVEEEPPPAAGAPRARLRLSTGNVITLAAMLIYAFCSTFVDQLFVNWVPLFLDEDKGLTPTQVGVYASLPLWGGAIGGAVGGVLNDFLIRRTGSRRWGRSGVAFTGKTLAAVLLAVSVAVPDGRWVAATLLACKFFGDWSLSTQWGAITDIGGRAAGTMFGVVNMAGSVAGVVANPFIGQIKRDHGWDTLFYSLAALFLAAAVAWLFIDSNRRLVAEDFQDSSERPS